MTATAILGTTYFGPVQWYQKLNRYASCEIEQYEHFIRQTYRNRCVIATTQGLQSLTVPVEAPEGGALTKTDVRDIRVSDHGNWRHLHWHALLSAYGESPFFEFYADDLRPFFEKRFDYLLDLNMAITEKMCELLDIQPKVSLTDRYLTSDQYTSMSLVTTLFHDLRQTDHIEEAEAPDCSILYHDYRDAIRPKRPLKDLTWEPKPYYQVYQQKFGFQPNLSILDLLFNMGNEAVLYL